jgi:hypothetical protein
MLNINVINWLLEENEPSIRYRTLTELCDIPVDDPQVIAAKEAIIKSKNVTRVFSKLDENGLFPHKPEYYGNFTTFNFLNILCELGLNKNDDNIKHIVDWILTPGEDKHEHFVQKEFQNENAYLLDKSNLGSCRQVGFLSVLVRLGFLEDKRVSGLIDTFIEKSRFDGGYLCKWKKSNHPGQEPKSCYAATVPALMLYAWLPAGYRNSKAFDNLIDYFLKRNIIYSKQEKDKIIADTRLGFYSTGLCHLLTVAYAMSKLGYGNAPEMESVWDILEKKKDENGKYASEYAESKKPILMEPVGKPNKWITFYVLLAEKYKDKK